MHLALAGLVLTLKIHAPLAYVTAALFGTIVIS
jgi:hypothetical protein